MKTSKKNTQEAAKAVDTEVLPPENQVGMENEGQKRSHALSVAGATGAALSLKFVESTVDALQRVVGKKFVVTPTGLKVADGVKEISELDAAKLIASLAETTEREDTVRTTINFALGDAIHAVRLSLGEEAGDKLIEQVVSEHGKGKHTVQDTARVVEWVDAVWEFDERPVGLSFTHFAEGKNYSRDKSGKVMIQKAKVKSIFEKVVEGEVVASGTKADGTPFEQRKVLSCAKLRELLKAARPDKEKPEEEDEKDEEKDEPKEKEAVLFGFTYMDYNDPSSVTFTEELDGDLLTAKADDGTPAYLVFDLGNKSVLKPNGKVWAKFSCPDGEE